MGKKARKKALRGVEEYLRVLQPLLGLQQWTITVEEEPPASKDHLASNWRYAHSWNAHIRFADRHFTSPPEEQRITAIHELLHLHTMDLHAAVDNTLEWLDHTPREWARERLDHEHEKVIDALSRVLAPLMPLPNQQQEG